MQRVCFVPCAVLLFVAAGAARLPAADRIYIVDQSLRVGETGAIIPVRADTDEARYGFSLSIKYDQARLRVTGVEVAGTVASSAEWSFGKILEDKGAISWGVAMDLSSPLTNVIPAGKNQALAHLRTDVLATGPGTTPIAPQDRLQPDPPGAWKNILVAAQGVSVIPQLAGGTITIEMLGRFRRADSDASGTVDLTDAISVLGHLFLGASEPGCLDAADADDSGVLDLTDAIFSLGWQFLGGPAPPAPGTSTCGGDPSADNFKACVYPGC